MTRSPLCGRPPQMLDLFSGIGGFSLAGHWAGFETCQFVEIEDYPQRVLAKNFPGVPIHGDIRTFDATKLVGRIDVVSGGFPCQDISGANPNGKGIDGERSGLWSQMLRIVLECRPLFVLAENSHYLRTRGSDRVLGELEAGGYTASAFVVGAGTAGAPHWRKRAFVVAADATREQGRRLFQPWLSPDAAADHGAGDMAPDPDGLRAFDRRGGGSLHHGDGHGAPSERGRDELESRPVMACLEPWRRAEPPVPGVDAGFPGRLDRARALGNTVVPQVAYVFLKAIHDQLTAPFKENER